PPHAHLKARKRGRAVGTDRGPPRGGGAPSPWGLGNRRVERVSVRADVGATFPWLGVQRAISVDDLRDSGSEVVHRRESRSATASRTSSPRAYAGPTQDGQPVPHPQESRCSRARSRSTSVDLKSRS